MRFFSILNTFKILFLSLLISEKSWSYPEFIGYGYSSCVTCHYNGHGNGALNDYGRAVWSAEIASRVFSGKATDDELGASSGFLGRRSLPFWVRPGIKARNLNIQTNPGGTGSLNRNILMQGEANLALIFNEKESFVFVGSYGYAPEPLRLKGQAPENKEPNVISREHYFRWHAQKNFWLYLGLTDKVFGIRHVNHTAFSRAVTGLAQNDQSHGLIGHYIQSNWELSLNAFAGNLSQKKELRQQGASILFDYELAPLFRLGTSYLNSKNDFIKNDRFAVHTRAGYEDGTSLLFEVGYLRDAPNTSSKITSSYYIYSQFMQKLFRGYHLFIGGQSYKGDLSTSGATNLRANAGLLIFPMSRLEFRFEVENARKIFDENVTKDTWAVLSQVHLSL